MESSVSERVIAATYHTGKYPAKGTGKGMGADQPYPYPYPVNTRTQDPGGSALPVLLPTQDSGAILQCFSL